MAGARSDTKPGRPVMVKTAYGRVIGLAKEGVVRFKGIPFAAPPVGSLRFLPPQPVRPWRGVRDCTHFRHSAVQSGERIPGVTYGEDCLYLNLWRQEEEPLRPLPVLVYIHGGGFSDGSPANPIFSGSRFAKHGVLQVNVTYRLNALGFMPFEEVTEEYGNVGNCGLLDQIAALQWVRDNIAAFGGDPHCVTICGESAGAFSVSGLILSPLAKGLFQRAIMESGNLLGQPILAPCAPGDAEQALVTAKAYAAQLGARSLREMQAIDAKKIASGSGFRNNLAAANPYAFFPVFDGHVLPKEPYKVLTQGNINEVSLLAGFNTDEGSIFVSPRTSEEDYIHLCWHVFKGASRQLLSRYPVNEENSARKRVRDMAKMGLRFGSDVYADELSRRGMPVYYYNFDFRPRIFNSIGLGAMHALELLFVFDTSPRLSVRSRESILFQREVHARWLNFIRNGNPNEGVSCKVQWPQYTADEKKILQLNENSREIIAPEVEDVAFYRRLLWEA